MLFLLEFLPLQQLKRRENRYMVQEENKTSYYLAQEAMELPITKAFSLLPLLDRQEGYDEED